MGAEKFYREGSVEELAPAVVPAEMYSLQNAKNWFKNLIIDTGVW